MAKSTKNKLRKYLPFLVVIGLLAMTLIGWYGYRYFGFNGSIPANVIEEYKKQATGLAQHPTLKTCLNLGNKIYVINTGGGFGGYIYIYSAHGQLIERQEYSDVATFPATTYKVDLTQYECRLAELP